MTGSRVTKVEIEEEIEQSLEQTVTYIETVIEKPTNYFLLDRIQGVGIDFAIGAIVNAFLSAMIIYIIFLFAIKYQRKLRSKKEIN